MAWNTIQPVLEGRSNTSDIMYSYNLMDLLSVDLLDQLLRKHLIKLIKLSAEIASQRAKNTSGFPTVMVDDVKRAVELLENQKSRNFL
ncbi:MAG TPA: hypothetical protein VJL87_01750 [Bdellovibrionota bacterium]|nr:hypothetical protein [Bdellovibrionota bacterium]